MPAGNGQGVDKELRQTEELQMIEGLLQDAQRVLLVSHVRPDGDAIGSLLGFGLSLYAVGKDVQMVSGDGVPVSFRHLKGSDLIVKRPSGAFDFICVVDCSDLDRVGGVLNNYAGPDINIDHHVTNVNYAKINLVDPKAVATAQILTELLPALDLPITRPVAEALLTGILTDTLGFGTSNMTPKALRVAADLMEIGADLPTLYYQSLVRRTFSAANLWGIGLSRLEREDRLIWTSLTLDDRRVADYRGWDDAELVNILASIDSADVAMVFMEQPHRCVKVSWRARPGYDVSKIALSFGGGGHPSASGVVVEGDLEAVKNDILEATRPILQGEQVKQF